MKEKKCIKNIHMNISKGITVLKEKKKKLSHKSPKCLLGDGIASVETTDVGD